MARKMDFLEMPGREAVLHYSCWFGVDSVCAFKELRRLGARLSEEFLLDLREQARRRFEQRRRSRAPREPEPYPCREEEFPAYEDSWDWEEPDTCWVEIADPELLHLVHEVAGLPEPELSVAKEHLHALLNLFTVQHLKG